MSIRIGSRYEWIRGDYQGIIDEVSDIQDGFVIFKSGRRCNSEIFNEFLLPEDNLPLTQDINFKGVSSVDFKPEDDGEIFDEYGQPVRITKQTITNRNSSINNINNTVSNQQPVVEKKVNPITLLINQASKDETVLSFNYTIKLPKKSLYLLIKDSFEGVDIDTEILESVFSEIDINELKDYFKKELLEKIKLHYKQ